MIKNPRVGMKVRFTTEGLLGIGGITSQEEIAGLEDLTITHVSLAPVDHPEPIYDIELSEPFDKYLVINIWLEEK